MRNTALQILTWLADNNEAVSSDRAEGFGWNAADLRTLHRAGLVQWTPSRVWRITVLGTEHVAKLDA